MKLKVANINPSWSGFTESVTTFIASDHSTVLVEAQV